MILSNYAGSRDNNFNLIRMLAAFIVLIEHSFVLVMNASWSKAQVDHLGDILGRPAIDVFFVTSGFLICASLLSRRNIIDFFVARFLRIYPALLIVLLVSVFVIGPLFTSLALKDYLTDSQTFTYLFKGLVLLAGGVDFFLPGVFIDNPYQGVVNGSLWTIPFEVVMYLSLGIGWFVLATFFRKGWMTAFRRMVVVIVVVTGVALIVGHLHDVHMPKIIRLAFMFFTGSLFYLFREKIVLSFKIFIVALGVLLVSFFDEKVLFVVYVLVMPYILFYMAYIPGGFVRKYNRLGDYSYGVYIYSFPVQQMIVATFPSISVAWLLIFSSMIGVGLGVLSWTFVEKRALNMKASLARQIKLLAATSTSRENLLRDS
ncbi:MAG: acyltransferase [Gammaproteobacteria bacterium]|nr:acyltransferase [Gammaproteobacteria bacterium]MBU1724751.1 acyltransferase [Gammaproteobacteria bacterium]MBU2005758.1 acyltransferase [Gammaproteobacteria bacterium]